MESPVRRNTLDIAKCVGLPGLETSEYLIVLADLRSHDPWFAMVAKFTPGVPPLHPRHHGVVAVNDLHERSDVVIELVFDEVSTEVKNGVPQRGDQAELLPC